MKAVHIITGRGLPLKRSDVDTDQIIPAEWLKRVERTGFEKGLFATWRDDRNFVLNDERYAGASVLVAGPSFGVGSSREHAVWAIQQGGFDAVIAGDKAGRGDFDHGYTHGLRAGFGIGVDGGIGVIGAGGAGQSQHIGGDEAGEIVDVAVGVVVNQPVAQP